MQQNQLVTNTGQVTLRFILPSAELRPYITTYYCMDVDCAPGEAIEDFLHPEWGNLRFQSQAGLQSAIGTAPLQDTPMAVATGPTSFATRFRVTTGRYWGIGLMPLGWATFIAGDASIHADALFDMRAEPATHRFLPLADTLHGSELDHAEEIARIEMHLLAMKRHPVRDADAIALVNAALVEGRVTSVSELAKRCGMTTRSLERLSLRAFGFTPKLLLRRQRFLRSLAQFMLDPSLKWLGAIDWQYHDQAHFVRDFRRFMTMSPTEYRNLEHPILKAAAWARMKAAGEAVQGLHDPARGPEAAE